MCMEPSHQALIPGRTRTRQLCNTMVTLPAGLSSVSVGTPCDSSFADKHLASRASVDIQISAQYVAYNMHYLSQISGGLKAAVVTHSQGGLDTQWALQFYPSTWQVTSAFLPLAPDLVGLSDATPFFKAVCPDYKCQPSVWQQLAGSRLEGAMRSNKNFKATVPYNAVWTAVSWPCLCSLHC